MTKPLGVILAGGQSSRMGGGDKCLRMIDGRCLLDHVIARLAPQVGHMAINANGDARRFAKFDLPVVADSIDGFAGPLAGVLAGLDWAAEQGADSIVTAAADTPFFPGELVVRLQAAAQQNGGRLALAATPHAKRGLAAHPTFGLWPVALRQDLRVALQEGVRKVVAWTDRHNSALAEFGAFPFDPFFNINTPDDMAEAQRLLQEITR